jgi:hypothetical protein
VEKYDRPRQVTDDDIIQRMRFECRINKATDTRSEYIALNVFPQQQCLRERACVTLCLLCLSCLNFRRKHV